MTEARGYGLETVCSSITTSLILNPGQLENNYLMVWIAQRILCSQPDPCFSFIIKDCFLLILDIDKISYLF